MIEERTVRGRAVFSGYPFGVSVFNPFVVSLAVVLVCLLCFRLACYVDWQGASSGEVQNTVCGLYLGSLRVWTRGAGRLCRMIRFCACSREVRMVQLQMICDATTIAVAVI